MMKRKNGINRVLNICTMKHISFDFVIALAAFSMIAAGCKKEAAAPATVTLGVQIATDTKTYIDAGTRYPMWTAGDEIAVNGLTDNHTVKDIDIVNGNTAKLYNVQEADHYYAIYPYDIVRNGMSPSSTTILLDNVQTYKEDSSGHQIVEAPMAAYSTTTTLTFHNLGALLRVRFTNDGSEEIMLSTIKVKGGSYYLCGYGLIENITGTDSDVITMTSSQYSYKDVTLDLGTKVVVDAGATKDLYVVLPAFAEQSITVTLFHDASHYATFTGTKALDHNKIATVNFKASDIVELSAPLGAVNSLFTINSNGDQVYFSRGNLQCTLTADKTCSWAFANHQWDYIGDASGNAHLTDTPGVLSSYPGTVDLFKWSTDNASDFYGIDNGGNPYLNSNFKDWGVPVTEGRYYGGTWRKLEASEWTYITQGRSDTYKYTKCNVHGVKGMILFPDNYSHPEGLSDSIKNVINGGDYTTVAISDDDWSKLDLAGCVFLPAAGERGSEYNNTDQEVFFYWLATNQAPISAHYASGFSTGFGMRLSGYPVRLVQDVE
ncbi:MAG: hypothetical protein K6A64_03995 [Bacteroidales bacterium]|nr:hypothetical protein [Bacteroidales bacterium]